MNKFTPISGSSPTDERIKQLPNTPPMKKKLTTKRITPITLFIATLLYCTSPSGKTFHFFCEARSEKQIGAHRPRTKSLGQLLDHN